MKSKYILAVDIGGTKCAISVIDILHDLPIIVDKVRFLTPKDVEDALNLIITKSKELMNKHNKKKIVWCGISCGGPLDSKKGLIVAPPNLNGWINIPIVNLFEEKIGIPTSLENDANAGALAEWYWGAGRGKENVVFCTFGTGMGAGFILNNKLYQGTNSLAGEIGHVRLEKHGPIGFGKNGSVEGFCSGGGIARQAQVKITKWLTEGKILSFCKNFDDLKKVTAESIGKAASDGDKDAIEIYEIMSKKLGQTVSLLIDILNPEVIILGSIYIRQEELIKPIMMEVIKEESIPDSLKVCEIQPAKLHENIGDYAAAAIAKYAMNTRNL